jgi:light-regulated signal transduction histidine kinase (bacteriophytochrome)
MQQQIQGQQGQQQPVMMQPPQVVTIKDCLYLKDQLSWELIAMKKCHHFAQECIDIEIKQALEQAGQMHQRHYQLLLKHLQNNNTAEMTKFQQMQMQQ